MGPSILQSTIEAPVGESSKRCHRNLLKDVFSILILYCMDGLMVMQSIQCLATPVGEL